MLDHWKNLMTSSILLTVLLSAAQAYPQERLDFTNPARTGRTLFKGSVGFSLDPDTFMLSPGLDFFLSNGLAIGPDLQIGVSDHTFIISPSAVIKYYIDLKSTDLIRRLKPSFLFGLGLSYIHTDLAVGTDDDFGCLFKFGLGFDIFLNDHIALGNHMIFNAVTPPAREHFYFAWEFVTFKYLF